MFFFLFAFELTILNQESQYYPMPKKDRNLGIVDSEELYNELGLSPEARINLDQDFNLEMTQDDSSPAPSSEPSLVQVPEATGGRADEAPPSPTVEEPTRVHAEGQEAQLEEDVPTEDEAYLPPTRDPRNPWRTPRAQTVNQDSSSEDNGSDEDSDRYRAEFEAGYNDRTTNPEYDVDYPRMPPLQDVGVLGRSQPKSAPQDDDDDPLMDPNLDEDLRVPATALPNVTGRSRSRISGGSRVSFGPSSVEPASSPPQAAKPNAPPPINATPKRRTTCKSNRSSLSGTARHAIRQHNLLAGDDGRTFPLPKATSSSYSDTSSGRASLAQFQAQGGKGTPFAQTNIPFQPGTGFAAAPVAPYLIAGRPLDVRASPSAPTSFMRP